MRYAVAYACALLGIGILAMAVHAFAEPALTAGPSAREGVALAAALGFALAAVIDSR